MYRIAICEDEREIAKQNKNIVCHVLESRGMQQEVDFSVTVFFETALLMEELQRQPAAYQLLLLDIELGEENGLRVAGSLREMGIDSSIVYITAHRDYVFDSFDTRPLSYLLKPVSEEKLAKIIERDWRENYQPEQVALPVSGGWRTVSVHNILYAEAYNHKSVVHLKQETLSVNCRFSDLLLRLEFSTFCRCHFSIVVNLKYVYRISGNSLELTNGRELPVSRSRQQEVKRRFVAYLKE